LWKMKQWIMRTIVASGCPPGTKSGSNKTKITGIAMEENSGTMEEFLQSLKIEHQLSRFSKKRGSKGEGEGRIKKKLKGLKM